MGDRANDVLAVRLPPIKPAYERDPHNYLGTSFRLPMLFAAHGFAAHRWRDDSGWVAVIAVLMLTAGLRYEGFETCRCSREPKFRPRTSAQLRQRRRLAARNGLPIADTLAARDPYDAPTRAAQNPST